ELCIELVKRVRLARQRWRLLAERLEDALDLRLWHRKLRLHDRTPLLEAIRICFDEDFYVHQIKADLDVGVRVGHEIELVAFLYSGRLHSGKTFFGHAEAVSECPPLPARNYLGHRFISWVRYRLTNSPRQTTSDSACESSNG